MQNSILGKEVAFKDRYSPEFLFAIPRAEQRAAFGLLDKLPFSGHDLWTVYELSWLDKNGKPVVAVGEIIFPFDSPNLIESKSLKLYLNSFSQEQFGSLGEVVEIITRDLAKCALAKPEVRLWPIERAELPKMGTWDAHCIDGQEIVCDVYRPSPQLLRASPSTAKERLCSHLLKSNCPVTGQPDWASVLIDYEGEKIDPQGLLRYIVSFRHHTEFHEHCVERMFIDILTQCRPKKLSIEARYTRRGGLDINPFRTNVEGHWPQVRLIRQ